jgi:hypothetical protein
MTSTTNVTTTQETHFALKTSPVIAASVYQGTNRIGWVSTSGEVYQEFSKVGWVTGNGDLYRRGVRVGRVTRTGAVLDEECNRVGQVSSSGLVQRGTATVGYVDCAIDRYCMAGATLLLLFC